MYKLVSILIVSVGEACEPLSNSVHSTLLFTVTAHWSGTSMASMSNELCESCYPKNRSVAWRDTV